MSEQEKAIRRYSEAEIAKILERATELQGSEPGMSSGAGMTLSELEDVAMEAGIDVGLVRRAALEVDTSVESFSAWRAFLGEDLRVRRETTLPAEIPERAFESLLGVVQSNVQGYGQPSLLGRTLTWQGGGADG